MSDAALWVHCSLCMTMGESSSRLMITSCGRIICSTCCPKHADTFCETCAGPCNKIMPLNRKAPPKVLSLFKNASSQLKEVFKNVSWQEKQKQSILEHKKANIERLEKEEKGQVLELERLEKELEVMREEMRVLENEEKELQEIERTNVFDEESGIQAAKLNHLEQLKGVNRFNESRSNLVEKRQRTNTGSHNNSSVKQHPGNIGNMPTFAGGATAMVKIGSNLHRLDKDLEGKSGATFSNERVGNGILSKYPKMSFQRGGLREPLQ